MNKNILHKTDKFFLDNLEDHVEVPGEHVWETIEKKLSEKEKHNATISMRGVLSIAALMLLSMAIPFLLVDTNFSHQFSQDKKINKQETVAGNEVYNRTSNQLAAPASDLSSNTSITAENDQDIQIADHPIAKDFSLAPIASLQDLNNERTNGLAQMNNFNEIKFVSSNDINNNKTVADKPASTIIQLPKKYRFSIMPFFSVDHISGRFIEQYEFDNLTMNDYSKREKPDLSYTAGVLGSYRLNKKFSLSSGISFSSSMLSITSTAVNALRDAEGKYKFKLATSYGLAEISQSGIQPMAGDSLLISGATMQFNYISFPVLVNYDITGRRLKLAVHGGLALNNVISEKMEVNYNVQNNEEAETINKIEGIRSIFFTLNTGVEAKYSLNHKTDISISPELRYGINAINKGTPIKTYPINYGLSFNFYYKF